MSPAAVATRSGTDFIAQMRARLTKIRNDLMAEAAAAMEESLQAGEDVAHQRIESAVTPTGLREHPDHPGRVDTGSYDDDFKHDSYQLDPSRMQGRMGWIGDEGNFQAHNAGGKSYVELQEEGFTSPGGKDNPGGTDVAGVHALLDAATVAKAEFKKRLTDYVRQEFS